MKKSLDLEIIGHGHKQILPYLFLTSPSFGASGGLCFIIVAFPGYLYLYFCNVVFLTVREECMQGVI